MHCVTQWSNYDNQWQGVFASTILALVQPQARCKHIIFHSYDDYTTNLRLEQFAQPDVMLVHTGTARRLRASMAARCGAWCRVIICGNRRNG